MAQTRSDNIELKAPKKLDNITGRWSSGRWRPYNNVQEYLDAYPVLASRAWDQEFYVRSSINTKRSDVYRLDADKVPYLVYTADQVLYEVIPFSGADGPLSIDFTVGDRESVFPRPKLEAFNTPDEDTEIKISGFQQVIKKNSNNIVTIELDGIFASGYILLTN